MIEYRWADFTAEDPQSPTPQALADAAGILAVDAEHQAEIYGEFSPTYTPQQFIVAAQNPNQLVFPVLALDGGSVVGYAELVLPQRENLTTAYVFGGVLRSHRRRGIATELARRLRERALAEGRTTLQIWNTIPLDTLTEDPAGLPLPETSLRARRDAAPVAFLSGLGATAALLERESALDLTENPALDSFMTTTALEAPEGYTLHTMAGQTPEHLLEAVAEVFSDFAADMPSGELTWDREVWTAERVREMDENRAARETDLIAALVTDSEGRGAAYSNLGRSSTTPLRASQGITMVLRAHRGHGLGALTKAANVVAARERWPEARRIYTTNADHNAHMLAINTAMGFRLVNAEIGWKMELA